MGKEKITKNIFKVSFLTYIFILIGFITGNFKQIISYMSLIIFHELGHFLTALFFNWNVDKIYIYPLGGITKFNEDINKPIIEELLITIMGPIFQVLLSLILKNYEESMFLLVFNLLPIVPLDGGKLVTIIFSLFKPFKKVLVKAIITSYVSYSIVIFLLLRYNYSLFFLFVTLLLLFKIQEEKKKTKHTYNKFLLERYLNRIRFKKNKYINTIEDFYKYRNNIIMKNNRIYSEHEILSTYYK